MLESLLVLSVVVNAILAVMAAVLWVKLWLSRRDVRLTRRLAYMTQDLDEPAPGGCLGMLIGPVLLILLGLLALAFMPVW